LRRREIGGRHAADIKALQHRAVGEYTPVVEAILRSRSRDARQIERTLSGLLDFCSHPLALLLYRRLCRHYFEIDPEATVFYVEAYRERWDSEGEEDLPPIHDARVDPSPRGAIGAVMK
jgi:hypothetical protein